MALNIHEEIRSNKKKSAFLILGFFIFIGLLGAAAGVVYGGYSSGNLFSLPSILFSVTMALSIAGIYLLIFLKSGEKMILKATGAKPASRTHHSFLFHTTETLSIAAGMSTPPKCYVIEDTALNAYATGFKPEKSYVVVTTGLLKKLNKQEIEGVLAHEISHIKNQDIKIMLIAAGLVGATVLLADIIFRTFLYSTLSGGGGGGKKDGKIMIFVFVFWLVLIILSPFIAQAIKLAISRQREYLADASGALLTRYPEGLASALEKIKNDPNPLVDTANKATAHLFISTPFKKKVGISNLFATHPPIDERIARLRGKK